MRDFRSEGGSVQTDEERSQMAEKGRFKKNREFKRRLDEEDDNEEGDIRSFKFHRVDFERTLRRDRRDRFDDRDDRGRDRRSRDDRPQRGRQERGGYGQRDRDRRDFRPRFDRDRQGGRDRQFDRRDNGYGKKRRFDND